MDAEGDTKLRSRSRAMTSVEKNETDYAMGSKEEKANSRCNSGEVVKDRSQRTYQEIELHDQANSNEDLTLQGVVDAYRKKYSHTLDPNLSRTEYQTDQVRD